jgi:hypothetical protein
LAGLEQEKLAFLLRCAVQNGFEGAWGKWLAPNSDNAVIVLPLIITLSGAMGQKPRWRSAYILECIFGSQFQSVVEKSFPDYSQHVNTRQVIKIITESSIVGYLEELAQKEGKQSEDAVRLLDEIQGFAKDFSFR